MSARVSSCSGDLALKRYWSARAKVYLEVRELFNGFAVEWRYLESLDAYGDPLKTSKWTRAVNPRAALIDAAFHRALLLGEAAWKAVRS